MCVYDYKYVYIYIIYIYYIYKYMVIRVCMNMYSCNFWRYYLATKTTTVFLIGKGLVFWRIQPRKIEDKQVSFIYIYIWLLYSCICILQVEHFSMERFCTFMVHHHVSGHLQCLFRGHQTTYLGGIKQAANVWCCLRDFPKKIVHRLGW